MEWLGRLYARRIVNVNVNILAAGALALGPLALTVHIATATFGLAVPWKISTLSLVADAVFDVMIYFGLHWVANHSPGLKRLKSAQARLQASFFKDASLVQFERATLSPILYCIALGLQNLLMRAGLTPVWATVIGFSSGILTSRMLHTLWMLRQERRAARAASPAGAGASVSPRP